MAAQMITVERISKDIPLVTVTAIVFYAFSYLFQLGFSVFWGYPSAYIEINLDIMLTTSVALLAVLLVAGHYIEGLFHIKKLSFWTGTALIIFFTLIINSLMFQMKSSLDILRGIFDIRQALVLGFVITALFAVSGIKKISKWPSDDLNLINVVSALSSCAAFAVMAGILYSMMPWPGYATKDDMLLAAKYSDNLVLAKCEKGKVTVKIVSSNSDVELESLSPKVRKERTACFIGNIF